jgi:biotin synthase-related radical SAM superfamily protein
MKSYDVSMKVNGDEKFISIRVDCPLNDLNSVIVDLVRGNSIFAFACMDAINEIHDGIDGESISNAIAVDNEFDISNMTIGRQYIEDRIKLYMDAPKKVTSNQLIEMGKKYNVGERSCRIMLSIRELFKKTNYGAYEKLIDVVNDTHVDLFSYIQNSR